MDHPRRKPNRLPGFDYASPGAYFVTVCSRGRLQIFWQPPSPSRVGADIIRPSSAPPPLSKYGGIVEGAVRAIPLHYAAVRVDNYCIMPNHLHLLMSLSAAAPPLATILGQMKRWASAAAGRPLWQKSYYDHVIRGDEDYLEKWRYIDENPARWRQDGLYPT